MIDPCVQVTLLAALKVLGVSVGLLLAGTRDKREVKGTMVREITISMTSIN